MEGIESSDLEEGEILENDVSSPTDEVENLNSQFNSNSNNINNIFKQQPIFFVGKARDKYLPKTITEDYVSKSSKKKHKRDNERNNSLGKNIKNYKTYYESSSDGEDESNHKYIIYKNGEKTKKKYSNQYGNGTAEDIMSQIGETICRKSHCNYKKRRSRDFKYKIEKISFGKTNTENIKSEYLSSHFSSSKSRKRFKRKLSCSESDCDVEVFRKNDRRRKKRLSYFSSSDEEIVRRSSGKKVRDFDEVRKSLLEKLKKQKEANSKKEEQNCFAEPEEVCSEIQEVEMMIDSPLYEDNPVQIVHENLDNIRIENSGDDPEMPSQNDKTEGDDEMDLVKLRSIALASNKRKNKSKELTLEKTENSEAEPKESTSHNREEEEMDLDRYELLLRAEALKTALLKKHKKILNKFRTEKTLCGSEDNNPSGMSEGTAASESNCPNKEICDVNNSKLDVDAFKENVNQEVIHKEAVGVKTSNSEVQTDKIETPFQSEKKIKRNYKNKRRKRKSVNIQVFPKEKNEKELVEEDDKMLRSQLLIDLLKKKSQKESEKKSVLIESLQTTKNISVVDTQSKGKPIKVVKRNALKKVNISRPRIPKPDLERIIVRLGPEDSTDDDEISSAQDWETSMKVNTNACDNKAISSSEKPNQPLSPKSLQASFERSVELLLSEAQKKIEEEVEKAKANSASTPEAVYKHLPPSQRLEYIRLKQKIAERERLKKLKNGSSSSCTDGRNSSQRIREVQFSRNKNSDLPTMVVKISEPDSIKESDGDILSQNHSNITQTSQSVDKNTSKTVVETTSLFSEVVESGTTSNTKSNVLENNKTVEKCISQTTGNDNKLERSHLESSCQSSEPLNHAKSHVELCENLKISVEDTLKVPENDNSVSSSSRLNTKPNLSSSVNGEVGFQLPESDNLNIISKTGSLEVTHAQSSSLENIKIQVKEVSGNDSSISTVLKSAPTSLLVNSIKPKTQSNSLENNKSLISKMPIKNTTTNCQGVNKIVPRPQAVLSSVNSTINRTNFNAKFDSRSPKKMFIASPDKYKAMQPSQPKNILTPPTQPFLSKLKLLLRKIKIEKSIEENYEKEIVKLKSQLSLFEKKKNEQRFKIKKLADESTKIYGMIQKVKAAHQKEKEVKKVQVGSKNKVVPSSKVKDIKKVIQENKDNISLPEFKDKVTLNNEIKKERILEGENEDNKLMLVGDYGSKTILEGGKNEKEKTTSTDGTNNKVILETVKRVEDEAKILGEIGKNQNDIKLETQSQREKQESNETVNCEQIKESELSIKSKKPEVEEMVFEKIQVPEIRGDEIKVEENPKQEISKNLLSFERETSQEVGTENVKEISVGELSKYNSPLGVFNKLTDTSERVNPNVIMCQHDLMGVCKDKDCMYQHLRVS